MAFGFHRIIEELRKSESAAIGGGRAEWGSGQPDHRNKIRLDAQSSLSEAGAEGLADFADLARIPRPQNWSVSISHANGLGAWVAVKRPRQVGFDIELKERIRPEIIERISTPKEIRSAPAQEYIWCAKEAYFKSLEERQPSAITQLEILGWRHLGDRLYSFEGGLSLPARGLVYDSAPYIFAVSLVDTSVPN